MCGALPLLPNMCPLNLSRGWVENGWISNSTPLNVSTELFITSLVWEIWNSTSNLLPCVHRTFYFVCGLKISGALPPHPYMCPQNVLSRGWVENIWSSTSTRTYVHWTFYHMALLRIVGALPPLPNLCPHNFLSLGWVENSWISTSTPLHVSTEFLSLRWVENMWGSTSTPLHVSTDLFVTRLGWELLELYPDSPTCVQWTLFLGDVLRYFGAIPSIAYVWPQNFLCRGWV